MTKTQQQQVSEAETPNNFAVEQDEAGMRLDAYLAERIEGWSRSRIQRLIENEDVLVNEKAVKSSHKLRASDEIDVDLVEVKATVFKPEDIPLDIVFEDEYLAVINKPAGMVVHPGAGVQTGTLANAIAYHFGLHSTPPYKGGVAAASADGVVPSTRGRDHIPNSPPYEGGVAAASADGVVPSTRGRDHIPNSPPYEGGVAAASADGVVLSSPHEPAKAGTPNESRIGIVHRLDKDTSGLIVVAKNDEVHEALSEQFRERQVHKSYIALVHGSLEQNLGKVDAADRSQ